MKGFTLTVLSQTWTSLMLQERTSPWLSVSVIGVGQPDALSVAFILDTSKVVATYQRWSQWFQLAKRQCENSVVCLSVRMACYRQCGSRHCTTRHQEHIMDVVDYQRDAAERTRATFGARCVERGRGESTDHFVDIDKNFFAASSANIDMMSINLNTAMPRSIKEQRHVLLTMSAISRNASLKAFRTLLRLLAPVS